uniref:Uncharacterized protein n=1 Tax=Hyaloperonospora arabidopsidis (strain Emoy2) TaxID=559515 RepID=M4BZZ4_HYAAE
MFVFPDYYLYCTKNHYLTSAPSSSLVPVTGHQSNTLDNQCGATITSSSASGASLHLCKHAEEGKQLKMDYLLVKVKLY